MLREASHEIGRQQVIAYIRFMERLTAKGRLQIKEIGNAYSTASRTKIAACDPCAPHVSFDAVLSLKRASGPELSVFIESKAAARESSRKKLPSQFADFVVASYCVASAWEDDMQVHRPMFVFLTNVHIDSPLIDDEALAQSAVQTHLEHAGVAPINASTLAHILGGIRIHIFQRWFQDLIG